MKKLLVILGDIASGKSTFARQIEKEFDIPLLCKDVIKEAIGGDRRDFTVEESSLISKQAVKVIFNKLRNNDTNSSYIIEANFHKEDLEEIKTICKENIYDCLLLTLEGDLDILFERYKERAKEGRHILHLLNSFGTKDGFIEYNLNNRQDVSSFNFIRIDSSSFSYQKNEELNKKIKEFFIKL